MYLGKVPPFFQLKPNPHFQQIIPMAAQRYNSPSRFILVSGFKLVSHTFAFYHFNILCYCIYKHITHHSISP